MESLELNLISNKKVEDKNPVSFFSLVLGVSIFMVGFSGLVFECILGAVSSYILDNTVEQFSIVIGIMVFMMGVASTTQRFISDKYLIEQFVAIIATLALLGGFGPIAVYGAFCVMEDHFILVLYSLIGVIGFLIGFEVPLLMRINQWRTKALRKNLATILGLDCVGSAVGTIVWTFYFLRRFPITETSFIVAGFYLMVALIILVYFTIHKRVTMKILSLVLIIASASVLAYGYHNNRSWNVRLEQNLYDHPIVFSKTTKYQHIVVIYNKKLDEYRLYINGNLQASSYDEYVYHEQLVHPVMTLAPQRRNVLILGGGDGFAVREVLKYHDVNKVVVVDIDPEITKIATNHPVFKKWNNGAFSDARVITQYSYSVTSAGIRPVFQEKEERKNSQTTAIQKIATVNILNVDASKFIEEVNGRWDVVIIDFPDPNAVELAKLYSKEFYLKLQQVLVKDGIVVTQATSPYHAKEAFLCVRRTMEAAGFHTLPFHDNVPSFGDWGWIIGWKWDESLLIEKIGKIDEFPATDYLTPALFRSSLIFGKQGLATANSQINTLMYPALLTFYTKESWKED